MFSQSVIAILETNKKKEITSKFHFCWENLDIDMIISNIKISNMINKETKVRNIGLGFTIVINYKILFKYFAEKNFPLNNINCKN